MIRTPAGETKIIDHMPFKDVELAPRPVGTPDNVVLPSAEGVKMFPNAYSNGEVSHPAVMRQRANNPGGRAPRAPPPQPELAPEEAARRAEQSARDRAAHAAAKAAKPQAAAPQAAAPRAPIPLRNIAPTPAAASAPVQPQNAAPAPAAPVQPLAGARPGIPWGRVAGGAAGAGVLAGGLYGLYNHFHQPQPAADQQAKAAADLSYIPGIKIAAQRARTEARRAAAAGDMAKADRIMTAPGVVSERSTGVPVRTIGQGNEGLAELAYHPSINNGQAMVKKTFNPQAELYSSDMIANKARVGQAMNGDPNFAKFYGEGQTAVGTPIHYNEFIAGERPHRGSVAIDEGLMARDRAEARTGLQLADVRRGNMLVGPDGNTKIIDSAPIAPHHTYDREFLARDKQPEHAITPRPEFANLLFPNLDKPTFRMSPDQIKAVAHSNREVQPIPELQGLSGGSSVSNSAGTAVTTTPRARAQPAARPAARPAAQPAAQPAATLFEVS
jgi:hypothetical protein